MVTVLGLGPGGSKIIQKHFDKVTGRLRDNVIYVRLQDRGLVKQLGLPDGLYLIRQKHLQSLFEPDTIVYDQVISDPKRNFERNPNPENDPIADPNLSRKLMHEWVISNFHGLCGHR